MGTPIANRNRTELEGLIGFFANTLVLRTHLSGDPSFRELLRRVRKVTTVPLLSAAERQQLLVEWNATTSDFPQGLCLHELIEAQVEWTPDAVAVTFPSTDTEQGGAEQLTYWELNQRANQLAHHLRRLGVGPEARVGICLERSLGMVVGLLGILKAGGAYVPLDPTYPLERLVFMLADAQAPVLLTQRRLLEKLPAHAAHVVCLDTGWEAIAHESAENPVSRVTPDNLAYVIYTSGSTGRPKGVMNTHRGICNRLRWRQDAYHLTEADRGVQKTPVSFDVSVWECFWPLLTGARLVVAQPAGHKDSAYLVNLIAEQQITTLHLVPSMLQRFVEEPGLKTCSSLRRVICSGEALPCDLEARFFARLGAELHNLYGPTEAAVDVTFWACERASKLPTVPIGRPIANTQIYLLDAQCQPVPIGVPGELHIGGVGLARGYFKRPELTAEKFVPNPFSDEPGPEFAVYRHLRTRNPCIDGAYFPKRLQIHRYIDRRIWHDIRPMTLYIRRHVPTDDPTATQTRSRRDLLPARRKLLP